MVKVEVTLRTLEDRSYPILIESGLLDGTAEWATRLAPAYTYVVITDSNVEKLYGSRVLEAFTRLGSRAHMISFTAGEKSKQRETKAALEDRMFELGAGRDSAVIALGGGVVGDVAGFVAATYMRGVPYVQVPTTLVACVDSSVGGKTGVDTPYGKNLIGAFHQPRAVVIDPDVLTTLPRREMANGLAEVIKYGVIYDADLFAYLEQHIGDALAYDTTVLTHIIERSCSIKAAVVESDERESNMRKILNFGHTVGHAIEALSSWGVMHGEAIAAGMVAEGMAAVEMGLWNEEELSRLRDLLARAGLGTAIPSEMDGSSLMEVMKRDKKVRRGAVEFVLPRRLGEMATTGEGEYGIAVDEELIAGVLEMASR